MRCFGVLLSGLVLTALTALEVSAQNQGNDAQETKRGTTPRPNDQMRWAQQINQDYPSEAIRNNYEGSVLLRLIVSSKGRVIGCEVMQSSGHIILDRAACDGTQRHARFRPARDAKGKAVEGRFNTTINYSIPDY